MKYSHLTSQETYLNTLSSCLEAFQRSFLFTVEVAKSIAVLLDGLLHQLRNYDCNYYRKYLSEGGVKMMDSVSKIEHHFSLID